MKFALSASLAMSVLIAQSAFANNLGALPEDQQPSDLVAASKIAELSTSPHEETASVVEQGARSNARGGHGGHGGHGGGGRGFGGGWGGWGGWGGFYGYPYSYYPSYYYPSYYYPSYYRSYYSNTPGEESSTNQVTNSNVTEGRSQTAPDLANIPVVCFASDAVGNWFANADVSQNAATVQEGVNQECLKYSANCNQNLGCALVASDK